MHWPQRAENGRYRSAVDLVDLPDENPDARLAWLTAQLTPFGARIAAVPTRGFPVPFSPHDTPLFLLIADQARRRYATTAGSMVLSRSTNDLRYLRVRGITCYGVLPFPLDVFQSRSIHSANERIRLDWFMDGVEFMGELVDQWTFATEPSETNGSLTSH
jgi:acetylornithine deacetylase/succinyl-diaminopimelate desuccinylase-like protein